MAVSVSDILKEMSATKKDNGTFNYNRFNKKNFEKLMKAMLNDPGFTAEVAKVKNGQLDTVEKIEVSKDFRKFIKRIVEKFGVDKVESERVLSADFTIDNVEGLYPFFAEAMYIYIEQGNRFDLLPKKDFKGSIAIKEVPKQSKTKEARNPQTKESLGSFKTTKDKHKVLVVKSSCPEWLKKREKA